VSNNGDKETNKARKYIEFCAVVVGVTGGCTGHFRIKKSKIGANFTRA